MSIEQRLLNIEKRQNKDKNACDDVCEGLRATVFDLESDLDRLRVSLKDWIES